MTMMTALFAAMFFALGCSDDKDGDGSGANGDVPKTLIISGIPDKDSQKLKSQYQTIGDYFKKELGVEVKWKMVDNYAGAVTALVSGQCDLAWLGGVTTVQAERQSKGKVTLVACRDIDLHFTSYVIGNKDAKLGGPKKFEDLIGKEKDLTLVFGSKSSTSGHVMPRHTMKQAGLDPKKFNEVKFSGDHSSTLRLVAEGAGDVGILNFKTYESASAADKAKAPFLFKTPEYVDYCWVAREGLSKDFIAKVRAAFTKLDESNPEHKKVLEANGASKFVEAKSEYWDGCRATLDELIKDGIFDW